MDPLVAVAIVLVLLWIGGLTAGVGGSMLHTLLVVAVVVFVVALLRRN